MKVMSKHIDTRLENLTDQLRRAWAAGLTVVTDARENIDSFVGRAVNRGEDVERDSRRFITGLLKKGDIEGRGRKALDLLGKQTRHLTRNVETARDLTRDLAGELTEKVNARLEQVLHRLKLVSRNDIEQLNAKIDRLTRKLEQLERK
jgi:poly(hydroxyalkanoate) granule-associated protein